MRLIQVSGVEPKLYPLVCIVVLNWQNAPDTMACIQSLVGLRYPRWRLIVCDNNSKDDSTEKIVRTLQDVATAQGWPFRRLEGGDLDHSMKMLFLNTGANLGYAGGNNRGMEIALSDPSCEYIWILNNDTVVDSEALSALVERASGSNEIGIVGSTLLYADDPETVQALGGSIFDFRTCTSTHFGEGEKVAHLSGKEVERALDCIVGASMLVSRVFVEEIGLLSEDYFLYFEEIDWAVRAHPKFILGYAPNSLVFHKEGGTTGLRSDSRSFGSVGDYYSLRNRLVFARKFVPKAVPRVVISLLKIFLAAVLKGRWKRALMFLRAEFWTGNGRSSWR